MKLVFASNNKKKLEEIRLLLPKQIQLVTLQDIGCFEEIEETANTIEENAQLKADYITNNYGFDCFADDSGLEVDLLNGQPGVFSARYAGLQKSDEDNISKLLHELENQTNRKAHFKTVIALNSNANRVLFTGIIAGEITTKKMGRNGFGYDPVFRPDNYAQTFAEMDLQLKATISHRGIAMHQLKAYLNNTISK